MKKGILLVALLGLVACAKDKKSPPAPQPEPVVVTPVTQNWVSVETNSRIQGLALAGLEMNVEQNYLVCQGSLRGNSETINPVGQTEGTVKIVGTEVEGTISFGHLYRPVDNVEDTCDVITKEKYSYKVTDGVLKLCNLNCLAGKWNGACQSEELACGFFVKQ